jgi:serine/threonine-protein kinase
MAADTATDTPPETPTLAPGGRLGGFYLHELINRGGFSEIWLASAGGQTYALRRLINGSLLNFTERGRFFNGCEVLAKLQPHPLIIGYVEHGKLEGFPYLLMEHLESSNLKQLLARADELLGEQLGNLLIDAAAALEHVHDRGYMHLDFKPENLLVSRSGNVKLIDFDLAQPWPDAPKKYAKNPGTPAYMAPEQLLREPYDHRADLYSYGVLAYELVTLQKPFPGDTPDEILARCLDRDDFPPPRELNGEVPPALERIILRCLERDPERRFPHPTALRYELEKALYV